MYELKEEIWGMKRERHAYPSGGFLHQEIPSTSYHVCENSATQPDLQRWNMRTFLSKEGGKGGTPKEESLGDYLQEYESQSERFKKNLSFLESCQFKEERSSSYSRRKRCM